MGFVLLVARSMGVGHAIERLELALVVGSKDILSEIVQRIGSSSLGSLRRKIRRINRNPKPKDGCLLCN